MDELLNQECNVYSVETVDAYGKKTWLGCTTASCRSVKISRLFKDSKGNEISVTRKFWVADILLDIGAKIEYENKNYKVESVKEMRDANELFGCIAYCSIL